MSAQSSNESKLEAQSIPKICVQEKREAAPKAKPSVEEKTNKQELNEAKPTDEVYTE
eukprot:CAMPEP_0172559050 /NCGR_PEP_ID=MMETSP1067-20121228/82243_1 /TAXON_ID=265564 ORGANISM="Thalassiosira punctigera, Strain Tpunct2005C2" /NCGR_SAMPLE_ID=MMETSP1067 /ASSEMBLY_ACC=CAM_ASM_000444 /LENGTH=56 /DNA_ID=CAMNT_0013348553 /DNA_START=114 /DNA_END=281 /DNA_ORIENTATION=+